MRLRSAITTAALFFGALFSIGCNRGPSINGTFDVSFVWKSDGLESARVRAVDEHRSPSASQQEAVANLCAPYIADAIRAANLRRGVGVARVLVLGSPPYFVQLNSLTITEPDFSELEAAVEREDIERIRALVHRYGNVNQRELPSRQTALGVAAAGRHDTSLRTLLELGADVNSTDHFGVTPLMAAVVAGDLTAVRILIASGADTSATSKAGRSALSLAQELHRDQIAELLQTGGPNVHPPAR